MAMTDEERKARKKEQKKTYYAKYPEKKREELKRYKAKHKNRINACARARYVPRQNLGLLEKRQALAKSKAEKKALVALKKERLIEEAKAKKCTVRQLYYIQHKDKIQAYSKGYIKSNPDRHKINVENHRKNNPNYFKNYVKNNIERCTKTGIKHNLCKGTLLKPNDIPQELIDLKYITIKLKREIYEQRK